MDLAPLDVCVFAPWETGRVSRYGALQRLSQAAQTADIGPFPALVRRHVELIRQEARQIRRGEGFQVIVIVRLDGIHVIIRHFSRGVHRYLFKGHRSGTVHVKVLRLYHLILTLGALVGPGTLIVGIALRLTAEQPEGYIDPLDLL